MMKVSTTTGKKKKKSKTKGEVETDSKATGKTGSRRKLQNL